MDDFDKIYNRNIDSVYRVCFLYMKNKHDAEDMAQNTFINYLNKNPIFNNLNHEKAWFIVTASNLCKNHFKTWFYRNVCYDDMLEYSDNNKDNNILEYVLKLPTKYKQVIYLHYYEGYKSKEIASLCNINESTVRTHLQKGREILKKMIGSDLSE